MNFAKIVEVRDAEIILLQYPLENIHLENEERDVKIKLRFSFKYR
jgi:hypothetical protein